MASSGGVSGLIRYTQRSFGGTDATEYATGEA